MKRTIAITGKLDEELFNKFTEYLEANKDKFKSKSELVGFIVEEYLKGLTNKVEIEKLKQENDKLKETLANRPAEEDTEALKVQIERASNLNSQLTTDLERFKTENQNLKEKVNQLQTEIETPKLAENQYILTVPKSLVPFLNELTAYESARTGQKITFEKILYDVFYGQLKGTADLPIHWSAAERKRILEAVKKEKQNG